MFDIEITVAGHWKLVVPRFELVGDDIKAEMRSRRGWFRIDVPPDFAGRIRASSEDLRHEAIIDNVAAGAKDVELRFR